MRAASRASGTPGSKRSRATHPNPTRAGRRGALALGPHAVAGVDRGGAPEPGRDARRYFPSRQRVADVLVGLGLGEDDATDRAVGQDERTAAVAAVDLCPELEHLAPNL